MRHYAGMSVMASESVSPSAVCAAHPTALAAGACARCGAFFCEAEAVRTDGRAYCAACGARPEVSRLEPLRQELWGRRDVWNVVVGLSGVLHLTFGGSLLGDKKWLPGLLAVLGAVVTGAYALQVRWARVALVLLPLPWVALTLSHGPTDALRLAIFLTPLTLLFMQAVILFFDTRNRLAFRVEVPREDLEKLWLARDSNPRALWALRLGYASLVFPPAAVGAVVLGVLGLQRVDLAADPPVGGRAQAIRGLCLGGMVLLALVVALGTYQRWLFQ